MAKIKETEMPSINLLGAGTVIKGDITINGDFRLDGTLLGTIDCKGKIVVGPSGMIEGTIICQNADFSGNIQADVTVAELLTLKETARFIGNITTNKLAIEPGAKFSGTCQMEGVQKIIKPGIPHENSGSKEKP